MAMAIADQLQHTLADAGTFAALRRADSMYRRLTWALGACRDLLQENAALVRENAELRGKLKALENRAALWYV